MNRMVPRYGHRVDFWITDELGRTHGDVGGSSIISLCFDRPIVNGTAGTNFAIVIVCFVGLNFLIVQRFYDSSRIDEVNFIGWRFFQVE